MKNEYSLQPTSRDLLFQWIQNSRLLITQPVEKPQDVLYIEEDEKKSIICTLGNISLIQGQAKSRKTFLLSFICTALLRKEEFLKFKGRLPAEKSKIIYLDTEQGLYHAKKVQERIYYLAGISKEAEYEYFQYFHLRSFNTKQRIEIIEEVINSTPDLGFVIIDGIRDLVSDINNADESTRITEKLMKWSEDRNIHILCVLHENKGDRNSRGHIGTELQNKAESVIRVQRNADNKFQSIVEPVFLRDMDFESFFFEILPDGCPEVVSGKVPKRNYKHPEEMDEMLHKSWIKEVFATREEYTQNKYVEELKQVALKYDVRIGNTNLRDFVLYHIEQGFIQNVGEGQAFKLRLNT
jgi:hypothetical protein